MRCWGIALVFVAACDGCERRTVAPGPSDAFSASDSSSASDASSASRAAPVERARIEGSQLVIEGATGSARLELVEAGSLVRSSIVRVSLDAARPRWAFFVALTFTDGPRSSHGIGMIVERRGDKILSLWNEALSASGPFGSSRSRVRLVDVDADGRPEIVRWSTSHDDTGTRAGPPQIWRLADARFEASTAKVPSGIHDVTSGAEKAELAAVREALGAPFAMPSAIEELGPSTGDFAVGTDLAFEVLAPSSAAAPGVGKVFLVAVRTIASAPRVLNVLELGETKIAGARVAPECRLEIASRGGLRVADWSRSEPTRALLATWQEDSGHAVSRLVLWDGAALMATRPARVVESCDSPPIDLAILPPDGGEPTLREDPLTDGGLTSW